MHETFTVPRRTGISPSTAAMAIRHRRSLESELNRARRSDDTSQVATLIGEIDRLDTWLMREPAS